MKAACFIFCFFIFYSSSINGQQYYLRGEVKDEAGNPLQNVKIIQLRTGYVFRTGNYGSFGILTNYQADTLSFSMDGYQDEQLVADADNYLNVKLKLLPATVVAMHRDKLSSLTKDLTRDEQKNWFAGDETYASTVENHFINAQRFPVTGMSLNIDRASYSNIRRFINLNTVVPPDAVRIEEMLNYFNLNYKEPEGKDIFRISSTLTSCPWNSDDQLFYINLCSKKIDLDSLPPSNLVFLIDISGSMDMPNRLPLLKSAFRLLVNNLREKDTVSIVVYGGTIGIMLQPTSGCEKEKIFNAIDELTPGGFTPGESGIRLAYGLAKNHFIKNGNNRVILATDGDFNVGMKTEDELDELISQQRQSGIYLTCLGVGMGNYKDSKIQMLARKGNGNFAYLDNFQEAEKVLLTEFTQTLYAVANDVYMNVEFNPEYVNEYKLIGFDNKVGALKDTLSVIEGGEIGSGHSMMAIFEITPTASNERIVQENLMQGKFAAIKIQYRLPDDSTAKEFSHNCSLDFVPFDESDKCYQFSAAVVMFGGLLRSSPIAKNITWNDVIELADKSTDPSNLLEKEFVSIVEHAKTLYFKQKKKKPTSY